MENIDGIWVTYTKDKLSELNDLLKNKKTGWCIENEETARIYLKYSNINIYYTKDENGEYTVPRLGILKTNPYKETIIGILSHEQIEPEMIDVLEEKLNKFKDRYKYQKQIKDTKELINIENKINNNEELTKDELLFLYEIEESIKTFGYDLQKKLTKLKSKRDTKKDLSTIFNCDESLIGDKEEDLKDRNILVYIGNIDSQEETNETYIPKVVIGNINLPKLKTSKGLENLSLVLGDLNLSELKESTNLNSLMRVQGNLNISSLTYPDGLENLFLVEKYVYAGSLKTLQGIEYLEIGELGVFPSLEDKEMPKLISRKLNINQDYEI